MPNLKGTRNAKNGTVLSLQTGTKYCKHCDTTKAITEFHPRIKHGKLVLRSWCQQCERITAKQARQSNPETFKAIKERYLANHPEQKTIESTQARFRSKGIDPNKGAAWYKEHGPFCDICGKQDATALHLDHNHTTGQIRGFLCSSCNLALGKFNDNPQLLRKAADYLEHPPTIPEGIQYVKRTYTPTEDNLDLLHRENPYLPDLSREAPNRS